jgi:hypothetical protein
MQRRDAVYNAYWTLAAERQRIFERRIEQPTGPWTEDEILARYKFTNAWRASDRVTQYLIREVIYAHPQLSADDQLMRIVLFRLFSKPSTWRSIEDRLGPITRASLKGTALRTVLDELQAAGPIYTNAFILCATKAYGFDRKHHNHLALVRDMLGARRLPRAIARARQLEEVYDALRAFPLIGPFMAYQIAIDVNYSQLVDFSEDEFTVPGPGAERGIRKVFPSATRREMPAIIHRMVGFQEHAYDGLAVERPTLFGLPLRAIDCQNLFCELDKYARVRFPELRSNRSRIKASFTPSPEPLRLFYPPKWGINERLPRARPGLARAA